MKITTELASSFLESGINVLPLKIDKRPALKGWLKYQRESIKPSLLEGAEAIGVICGKVSGNLEVIDIDLKVVNADRKCVDRLLRDIEFLSKGLASRLLVQKTINHGYHLIYRCDVIEGNKKLANLYPTPEQKAADPKVKSLCLIETRGEGGYIVAHPSKGYKLVQNDFSTIPTITPSERATILDCCRAQNQVFEEIVQARVTGAHSYTITPWDDYDQNGDIVGLFQNHGWKVTMETRDEIQLLRPGSPTSKMSGKIFRDTRIFVCHSTSTEFSPTKGYMPSAVFALLNHGGNYSESSKALSRLGFGSKNKNQDIKAPEENVREIASNMVMDDMSNFLPDPDAIELYLQQAMDGTLPQGLSFGYRDLDKHFVYKQGNFNVINGHGNTGKSFIVWYLLCCVALKHNKCFLIYSRENKPGQIKKTFMEFFLQKRIREFTKDELELSSAWVDEHFTIIAVKRKLKVVESGYLVLQIAEQMNSTGKAYDGLLIDPYSALARDYAIVDKRDGSYQYDYRLATEFRDYCEDFNLSLWLVCHSQTEAQRRKDKDGNIMPPSGADIESGSMWFNRCDDLITVHRNTADPYARFTTEIHVRKIKDTESGGNWTTIEDPVKMTWEAGCPNRPRGFYDTSVNGSTPFNDHWNMEEYLANENK